MDFTNPFSEPVFYKKETSSTMDDALEALRNGALPGTLCWTSFQNLGRGRLKGRKWQSSEGDSLMMTLILPKEKMDLRPSLSLRAGLAVARMLEEQLQLQPKIKWPNDVYCQGKKLCGILCEFRLNHILLGIGLNLNQDSFPEDLPRAGSLKMITGKETRGETWLPHLLHSLMDILDGDVSLEEWNRRLLFRNEEIEILEGHPDKKKKISGVMRGITLDGALELELDYPKGVRKAIYSGELVFS